MIRAPIGSFLIFASFVCQTFGHAPDQSIPQVASQQQRVCECEELNQCYADQQKKDQNLLAGCREQCASQIFLKPTLQKVVKCYDQYEHAKSDADSRINRCIEEMGSRSCRSPQSTPQPQTFVINTTEFLHAGSKRDNRKISYPDSITSLNSCVRICVKNQGAVQFNADGKIAKPEKTGKKNGPTEKKQKNGKDHSLCASQLGCQLVPVDKKLEKQARHLCNLQARSHEDHESVFCACLENALGQNLHCSIELTSGTCSSTGSSCSETRKAGSKKVKP